MGEHAVRGVMTSHGDGIYKSTDAGKTWQHVGLPQSRHIAAVRIHPQNPDVVWVAVQGSPYGDSAERGIYKTTDGGANWRQGILHQRNDGRVRFKYRIKIIRAFSTRVFGITAVRHGRCVVGAQVRVFIKVPMVVNNWKKLEKGLPEAMGKVAIDVSPADSDLLYANIEAEGEKGGVYKSTDGGQSWTQTNKDRITVARSWYYIEIFADPVNPNVVYVLNAPMLKSIDGG